MPRTPFVLALALLGTPSVGACGGEPPTKPADAAPSASSSGGAGALAPSAAPSGSAESAPFDPSPLEPTYTQGKLHVAAYEKSPQGFGFGALSTSHFKVFPFADRMIVTRAGHVYELEGGKLSLAPKAPTTEKVDGETPMLGAYEIQRLQGRWPDELWGTAEFSSFMGARQHSQREVHYRRTGGKWTTEKTPALAVRPWTEGSFLGFVERRLSVVAGEAKPPTQASAPSGSTLCKRGVLVEPHDLAALPTGHVFLLGTHCETGEFVVESWQPGATESVVTPVTAQRDALGLRSTGHYVAAADPSSVFVALSADGAPFGLFRGDPRGFRRVLTKDVGAVRSLVATPDGAAFAVVDAGSRAPVRLVGLTRANAYTSYGVDRIVSLGGVWARDAATAYVAVATSFDGEAVLLATKEERLLGAPPADLWKDVAPTSASAAEAFPPFTDGCATPFVHLYDVGATTPKIFDFPKTRKALGSFEERGDLPLLDFTHAGKRRLGVPVPSAEVGRKLIRHVRREMPEDDPRLVCFAKPEDARRVE
jgi:hypothetical protein